MQHTEINPSYILPEIWSLIFSKLSPENILLLSLVSQFFKEISRNNFLWEQKCILHFPLYHQNDRHKNVTHWYSQFQKYYKTDYEHIDGSDSLTFTLTKKLFPNNMDLHIKKIFSFVKEGDLERLKFHKITPEYLDWLDRNNISLIEYANDYQHQHILDYFFELICINFDVSFDCNFNFNEPFNPQKVDDENRTILHWSIICNRPQEFVYALIHSGCDMNAVTNDMTHAIHFACLYGRMDIVELILQLDPSLLNQTDNLNQTPLIWAAANGHTDIVNYLASLDANLNQTTHQFNDACHKFTALHWAAKHGHLKTVSALIQHGAKLDVLSRSGAALHVACAFGHTEIVAHILMRHLDLLNQQDAAGQTPIMWAASRGFIDIVTLLADFGAELDHVTNQINDPHSGNTALHWAAMGNYQDIVKILLKHGASSIIVNSKNQTADKISDDIFIQKLIYLDRHIRRLENKNEINNDSYSNLNLFHYDKKFYSTISNAAIALKSALVGNADVTSLNEHKRELNRGKLEPLFLFFSPYLMSEPIQNFKFA